MWEAYVVGTIPVGAVVAGSDGSIVAHGRNRIFDRPHSGQLAGTRLAHAEINALLGLSAKRIYPKLTLYSALEPCHFCLAAGSASRVGSVHYAARDPYAGTAERVRLFDNGADVNSLGKSEKGGRSLLVKGSVTTDLRSCAEHLLRQACANRPRARVDPCVALWQR
jgi:tRNA(Arg) A34 adenosine deaminase TadA